MFYNYFALAGAPSSKNDLTEYIEKIDEDALNEFNLENILNSLLENDNIRIEQGLIYPNSLPRNHAVTCILFDHPNGLP